MDRGSVMCLAGLHDASVTSNKSVVLHRTLKRDRHIRSNDKEYELDQ